MAYPMPRKIILALLAVGLLTTVVRTNGVTINAASPSFTDVASAISSASDGDTVIVPAGTATWTNQLTINVGITLQAAGIGQTIIIDGLASGMLVSVQLVPSKLTRITGIEFRDGGNRATPAGEGNGILHFQGSNTDGSRLRVDHCYFNQLNGSINTENVLGVFDHCTWDRAPNSGSTIYCKNNTWNGGTWGDASYSDQSYFGTDKFLFVEDCTINGGNFDIGYGGSRFVLRYCTMNANANGLGKITTHGTETTGRRRSVRALEVYNNTFNAVGIQTGTTVLGELRGGIMLLHDNTYKGWGSNSNQVKYTLTAYRLFGQSSQTFLPADGLQPWDVNDTTGGPNHNGLYYNGTAAANSNTTTLTVTVSGNPGWSTNQWVGYSIRNPSPPTGDVNTSEIVASGSNTITWETGANTGNASGGHNPVAFLAGDTVEIRKVLHVLDQPGRSRGSIIGGGLTPNVPAGWAPNDQVTEPCYSWNNTTDYGGHVNFGAPDYTIRLNEHYFNNTAMPGYTPFVYPHPLVSGVPGPPQNLRVIP
jgi:hypothetical protein